MNKELKNIREWNLSPLGEFGQNKVAYYVAWLAPQNLFANYRLENFTSSPAFVISYFILNLVYKNFIFFKINQATLYQTAL